MKAQRPGKILLVDGDLAFLHAVGTALEKAEHEVTTCQTGQEARQFLNQASFEVVIANRRLSDESGEGLCQFIKTSIELGNVAVALIVEGNDEAAWSLAMNEPENDTAGQGASPKKEEATPPNDLISKTASPFEVLVRVQGLLKQQRYNEEIQNSIITLMKVAEGCEEQDPRARGHCHRLATMAVELGAVLGCDDWQLTILERAGYLHDVGKVCIPGAIIDKSQPLSPREMEIIRDHCVLGEKLVADVAALRGVMPVVRHHHERADGTGYPDGLRGDQIPVMAQVFSVVDIYDALRMWRPFRPAMNEVQAIDVMRQEVARGYWNRYIFNAFTEHVLKGLDERLDSMHILWPQM